jgi:hypothetical protein
MTAFAWFVMALALAINLHAIVALMLGSERRGAAYVSKLARRSWRFAAGFALVSAAFLVALVLSSEPGGDSQVDRARRLAMRIAETLNTAAFTLVACLLPVVAALVLRRRAQRGTGA